MTVPTGGACGLAASRCPACGEVRYPAVLRCPSCSDGGPAPAPVPAVLAGPARVVAVTRVHSDARPPAPWALVLADTDEGVRLVGFASAELAPDALGTGDAVRIAGSENGVPVFAPLGAPPGGGAGCGPAPAGDAVTRPWTPGTARPQPATAPAAPNRAATP